MLERDGKFSHAHGGRARETDFPTVEETPTGSGDRVFPLRGNGWDGVENPGEFLDNPAGGGLGMQGGKTGAANARKMAERSGEKSNVRKWA